MSLHSKGQVNQRQVIKVADGMAKKCPTSFACLKSLLRMDIEQIRSFTDKSSVADRHLAAGSDHTECCCLVSFASSACPTIQATCCRPSSHSCLCRFIFNFCVMSTTVGFNLDSLLT